MPSVLQRNKTSISGAKSKANGPVCEGDLTSSPRCACSYTSHPERAGPLQKFSAMVLKMWSTDHWGFPSLFLSILEIKTLSLIILKYYMPFSQFDICNVGIKAMVAETTGNLAQVKPNYTSSCSTFY